jgi:small GTP-binding protein
MSEKLDFSLVFCEFHDVYGPVLSVSFPEIESDFGDTVATKSINLLSEERHVKSSSLAFLPFPTKNKKGIAQSIEWVDDTKRGGVATGAFSLIFKEADDLIFYKYVKDLEVIFEEATNKLIELKIAEADNDLILTEIKILHDKFLTRLNELRSHEIGIKEEGEAFPDESEPKHIDEYSFKIVVCGDPACGKTSAILKFTDAAFRRTYIPTMGVDITKKEVKINDKMIYLVLWDIAGQVKYKLMRRQFYDGAKAILLLFDVTRPITFKSIPDWYKDIKVNLKHKGELIVLLCGNKVDLEEEREIKTEEAKKLADELNMVYLETSALTGENIDEAFHFLATKVLEAFSLGKLK